MPCDVFISYSHADDTFPSDWVTCLHNRLEAAIEAAAPGSQLTICRDKPDIRKSEDFNERIKNLLREAQVLLCVLSPAYNCSRYCCEELNFFVTQRRLPHRGLVRVEKKRVDVLLQPEPFQNILGYGFYEENGAELPAVNAQGKPDPRFDQAISPVAQEIVQLVEASRAPQQRVLVLASADREEERVCLANDLVHGGAVVAPSDENPLPDARREKRDALERHANSVDFAVLLLGTQPSNEIELVYDVLARRWSSAPRRCLFGMPLANPTDHRQNAFIDRINDSEDAFDFCDRPEQLLPETNRLLRALREQDNRTPTVYLSYLKSSRERAGALRDEIRRLCAEQDQRHGAAQGHWAIRILDPYGDGDSPQMRTQTEARDKSLRASHGGLVLVEQEGAFVYNALRDFDDAFPGDLRRYVAILSGGADAKVPPSLALVYPFIRQEPAPFNPPLPSGAQVIALSEFLARIRDRASKP